MNLLNLCCKNQSENKGEIMKTRTIVVISIIAILCLILAILMNNRIKMDKSIKSEIITDVPVNVVKVQKENMKEQLSLVGTITANNDVMIVSETQGRVKQVFAEVGNFKTTGSTLFKIEDELMYANYIAAEANYKKAKKDYDRFTKLFADSAASDSQLEGIELAYKGAEAKYIIAKKQYEDTKITTPISGIVTAKFIDKGSMVGPGTAVANVVDISSLKVKISVSEKDIFKIKLNDEVDVYVDAYPDYIFKGKIKTISDKADYSHTYPVEIVMPNNKKFPLKAGMFGRVCFSSIENKESVIIPRDALIGSAREPKVFVIENDIAFLRTISIGFEVGTKVQVINGLEEGEVIVTNGQNNLKDNSKVVILK
jgi:RND family efflux transporter MFP subunit